MVSYQDILNNNTSLKTAGSGLTAVFAGATSGIGLGALRSLTIHTESPTIYIVGRSKARLNDLIAELESINSTATFIPIQANDLSLIKDCAGAAEQIAKSAKKIDLLIMSQGHLALSREESPEGNLDLMNVIRHYGRMQMLLTLTPLLRAAPNPRVVSVLAGGQEGTLWPEDLELKDHFSLLKAAGAGASLTTLFMDAFSRQPGNENIVLVHLYPGLVGDTGLMVKGAGPWIQFLLDWVVVPFMRAFGYTSKEAGERVVFAATSGRFRRIESGSAGQGTLVQKGVDGVVGSGIYLVQGDSSVVTENKTLKALRKEGMAETVYQHTLYELDRVMGRTS